MAMWNNLLKLSLVSYIWRRYKKTVVLLPALLLYFWVVGLAHDDYLAYAELQQDKQWVGLSFMVKWLLLIGGVGCFVLMHLSDRAAKDVEPDIDIDPGMIAKAPAEAKEELFSADINDSFARIREKKSLSSKADVILKTNKTP